MSDRFVRRAATPDTPLATSPALSDADRSTQPLSAAEDSRPVEEVPRFNRHHAGLTHAQKRMRPPLLIAGVLMMIVAVSLHVGGAVVLAKTGFHAFALNNPIAYVVLGLGFLVAVFKLKYVLSLLHRKEK